MRAAFDELGKRDVPAALGWLTEHGITVDRSYAYTVTWPSTPALHAVDPATADAAAHTTHNNTERSAS